MKFIHYIEKVSGVDIFGLFSLIMFVVFFTVMLIWVFKTKNKEYKEISRIPLDNEELKTN
ncbi:MAG: cbb3-type cytochrome c oxidase subunit 3 [Chitinophagaceae bacterium]